MDARLRVWTFVFVALAWSTIARADARARVVLLQPPPSAGVKAEVVTRLEAELATGPFDVVRVKAPTGADIRAALEGEAARAHAVAAIVVLPSAHGPAADVWIVNRATGKTSIRTVEVPSRPGESAAAVLAIRAVELLRASLLEATGVVALPPPRTTPRARLPEEVSQWVAPEPRQGGVLVLGAGASVIQAFGGFGPALSPSLRAGAGVEGLLGRITVVAPLMGAAMAVNAGRVDVRQELATLEVAFSRRVGWGPLVPTAVLGVGAYHLTAFGSLEPPYRGNVDDLWAAVFTSGIGIEVEAAPSVRPFLDVRGLVTSPRPVVVVGGESVARAGGPSILVTLGVEARVAP